jgi:hypothetical protein
VYNTVDEIRKYHQYWLQNVNRMENSHLLKFAQQHPPHGKRDTGCPGRRWNSQAHMKANELLRTGL